MPAEKPLPAPVRTPTWSVVVGVQRVQRVRDALRDRLVHGVARVGAVQRDDEDPVAPLGEDSLIAHAGSLRAPVGFRPLAATHWT